MLSFDCLLYWITNDTHPLLVPGTPGLRHGNRAYAGCFCNDGVGMNTLREAAQQALEALENTSPLGFNMESDKKFFAAITALKAALAEPVQEPVYWEVRCTAHPKWMRVDEQQFDEYVANGWEGQRLYAAPPQRKPLTEEEMKKLLIESAGMTIQLNDVDFRLARSIERAHGIT